MIAQDNSQKTALVTGASRGIGQSIALSLAAAGYRVVGTATSDDGAQAISQALKDHNAGFGVRMQIQDSASIDTALEQLKAQDAMPDVLINNAGITRDNLLMRMSSEEWSEVIATNLNSLYHLCKPCIRPMMKKRWGRIINISSVSGQAGNPGQSNYAAAKLGMVGFSKSLAKELGSRNITVNCVAPGFIKTDMTAALSDEQKQELTRHIPLQRLGSCEEVASLVCFLASEPAGYITGETVAVNGGMYMN